MKATNLWIALAAGLVMTGCTAAGGAPAAPSTAVPTEKVVPVRAVAVERADLVSTLSYAGEVRAESTLEVVPRVAGRIERLNVDVGSVVRVGDQLALLDTEPARLALRQAEAGLATSRARLAALRAGPRPQAVAQADANARAARARVAALEQASRPEQVAQARAQVEAARARVDAVAQPRPELVGQADAAVRAAEARLAALEQGPMPEQVRAAEIVIEQAKNNLYAVQLQKDAACGGGGFACQTAQKQASAAEEGVKAAEQQARILKAPPTDEARAQARAALETARQGEALARRPAAEHESAQARNGVRAAEAALSLAQAPVLASELTAARAQAEAAEAAARLAAAPYTKQDLDGAEAQVEMAEAQVALARAQLKELTVLAPVDGVVAERHLGVGATAGPSTPIVSISAGKVEVVVTVDEGQIGRLRQGQPARVVTASLPGETLGATVGLVAPTVDPRTRTGSVRIAPSGDAAAKLRPGAAAQVTVESARKVGALVVPRAALGLDGRPHVLVVDRGVVRRVEVELGLQERDRVEVLRGLNDGDQVVLEAVELREGERVAVAAAH